MRMADPALEPRVVDVVVPRCDAAYRVRAGAGLLRDLGALARQIAPHERAAVVCDAAVAGTLGKATAASLARAGYAVASIPIVADEGHKTLVAAEGLYRAFLEARLDRAAPVVAVGGGVVGDLAGFAAATFMRGLPFINVPTTLLGMVDAAVGGKTAVNLIAPRHAGSSDGDRIARNLIGAFHQPALVVADVETLRTLPEPEFRAGLAECVKHAVIGDEKMFEWLEQRAGREEPWTDADLVHLVERNVRLKAGIMQGDERESRRRMVLNLGHTFAHALESFSSHGLRHGEAVALGLVAAAVAGKRMGFTASPLPDRLAAVLRGLGLPVAWPNLPAADALRDAMRHDKKAHRGGVRLVVPASLGDVRIVDDPSPQAILAGWQAIRG